MVYFYSVCGATVIYVTPLADITLFFETISKSLVNNETTSLKFRNYTLETSVESINKL